MFTLMHSLFSITFIEIFLHFVKVNDLDYKIESLCITDIYKVIYATIMIPITLSWPLHRSLITFEISKIFERFPFESDMQNFPLDLPIFYEDNSRISFHNYRDEIFFWRIQKKNHESSVRF